MTFVILNERLSGLPGPEKNELSLLSTSSDPYRCDTPMTIKAAQWLADIYNGSDWPSRPIHPRGIHYLIVSIGGHAYPTSKGAVPYENTDKCWRFLKDTLTAARWHGLIPFDAISDERNGDPTKYSVNKYETGYGYFETSSYHIPTPSNVFPKAEVKGGNGISGARPRMPVRIILMGEKTSLAFVFEQVAEKYEADIYLSSGNPSNALVGDLAKSIEEDERPALILFVGDADPQGHNMPLEVARKLQAFRDMLYPDIEYSVKRVGLTVDQAVELDLPTVPMKPTELRIDAWHRRMGVDHQYELDALATLRPDELVRMLEDEIAPHWDHDLHNAHREAVRVWERAEQERLDDLIVAEDMVVVQEAIRELHRINEQYADVPFSPSRFTSPTAFTSKDFWPGDYDSVIHSDVDWDVATYNLIQDKISAKD